jgi:hypothetical protein
MKKLLVLALALTGAPALAAPTSSNPDLITSRSPRVCALFPTQRTGARRICLTTEQWRGRLGNDWQQVLTGRNYEDDMDALRVRTRANPRLPAGACNVC